MLQDKKYPFIGIAGLALVIYGIAISSFFEGWSNFITETIYESILLQDSGQLLIATFAYVAKGFLLFFFIYFGSMMMTHVFSKRVSGLISSLLFMAVTTISIFTLNQLYQENFSYLSHFITITIISLLQIFIPKQRYFLTIFAIILLLVIMSMQWLQLIPSLSQLGIGTGDFAVMIKMADNYFTKNNLFNTLATIFFLVFLIIAIIFTFLIHLLHKQIYTLKKYHEQEEKLRDAQVALAESKVYQEIAMVVHDLNTPLVTVEGLLSLIQLKMQPEDQNQTAAYFNRMNQSLNRIKDMIAEILYENTKHPIEVKELLKYVTSHLCLDEQLVRLTVNIPPDLPPIPVNKIRFSRAIANLLENAITSFAGKAGEITINVKVVDNRVSFQIRDNGSGIEADLLDQVWTDGFSTRNSSGLGLSFVKKVVESHAGTVTIDSVPNRYTIICISIPIKEEGEINVERDHLSRR